MNLQNIFELPQKMWAEDFFSLAATTSSTSGMKQVDPTIRVSKCVNIRKSENVGSKWIFLLNSAFNLTLDCKF